MVSFQLVAHRLLSWRWAPVVFGKSIGHPDLPVMAVFGEAVWLAADAQGDARPRRLVFNRIAAAYGLLS